MTCRIDRLVVEDVVVLRVCGRITRQDADMLRGLLGQESRVVTIDLKHVLLVDHEAVKLLALHQAKGSELRNCPAYIREWVTRERRVQRRRTNNKRARDMQDACRKS